MVSKKDESEKTRPRLDEEKLKRTKRNANKRMVNQELKAPKVKTHVTLSPHVYLIGRKLGNVSALLDAAARHFIQHPNFAKFVKEFKLVSEIKTGNDAKDWRKQLEEFKKQDN
jgi:hypothetical protein